MQEKVLEILSDDHETKNADVISSDGTTKMRVSIFDNEVISGRKGYLCTQCGGELIAYKGMIKTHYFGHDPKFAAEHGRCPFSSEKKRHEHAKEILQITKSIVVPTLYKFPPEGKNTRAMLIQPRKIVEAFEVKNEICVFENLDGTVSWGKWEKGKYNEVNNLVRVDVAFFNREGKPFLLIEIVDTHKPERRN